MKTRLPLLLLLALTLVALPALAQRDLGPGSPGQPKKPPAGEKKPPLSGAEMADVAKKLKSVTPELTCAIEVYSPKGQAIQNGSDLYSVTGKYRVKISAILHGQTSVSNVKLTYNWSRNGKWQRPTNDPWSHTFASIAAGATVATVDAPRFEVEIDNNTPHRDSIRIEATIDADRTVQELNENNNTCSFEFFVQHPPA